MEVRTKPNASSIFAIRSTDLYRQTVPPKGTDIDPTGRLVHTRENPPPGIIKSTASRLELKKQKRKKELFTRTRSILLVLAVLVVVLFVHGFS
jgi:hypothetical protein